MAGRSHGQRRLQDGSGGGELRAAGGAACDDLAGAAFALTALGRNAQFQLNVFKTQAGTRMTPDIVLGNAMADANDHGGAGGMKTMPSL